MARRVREGQRVTQAPTNERRPGRGGVVEAGEPTRRIPLGGVNRKLPRGMACGCEGARHHESDCLDRRELLHASLLSDPFRCPRWTPDEELAALVRVHRDVGYARSLASWISGLVAA